MTVQLRNYIYETFFFHLAQKKSARIQKRAFWRCEWEWGWRSEKDGFLRDREKTEENNCIFLKKEIWVRMYEEKDRTHWQFVWRHEDTEAQLSGAAYLLLFIRPLKSYPWIRYRDWEKWAKRQWERWVLELFTCTPGRMWVWDQMQCSSFVYYFLSRRLGLFMCGRTSRGQFFLLLLPPRPAWNHAHLRGTRLQGPASCAATGWQRIPTRSPLIGQM